MLQEVIHSQEQISIDDVSSPLSAQILEFCDPEFFQETLQNSEVTSSSNCCYDENSSYPTNLSLPSDVDKFTSQDNNGNSTTATSTATTTTNANSFNNSNNLSIIFDSQDELDNDISASIDFTSSPTFPIPQFSTTQQDQFDFAALQPQITLADGFSHYPLDSVAPLMGHLLPAVFEEDCLSSVPSCVPMSSSSPSCSFLGPAMAAYMPAGPLTAALSAESSIFGGSILMGQELQPNELEYQADNVGIDGSDPTQRVFNTGDVQVIGNESQQLVAATSTPLASEISSLEDSTFKVTKLSVEQRKEKIHRYMKKRNERNFSKKIKYACRKTLADSRPRVRGRFAKNDEFGETHRAPCSSHDEDDDEITVKEEDDMVDSADIFAHISGVNSFKCNYSIQSWI